MTDHLIDDVLLAEKIKNIEQLIHKIFINISNYSNNIFLEISNKLNVDIDMSDSIHRDFVLIYDDGHNGAEHLFLRYEYGTIITIDIDIKVFNEVYYHLYAALEDLYNTINSDVKKCIVHHLQSDDDYDRNILLKLLDTELMNN